MARYTWNFAFSMSASRAADKSGLGLPSAHRFMAKWDRDMRVCDEVSCRTIDERRIMRPLVSSEKTIASPSQKNVTTTNHRQNTTFGVLTQQTPTVCGFAALCSDQFIIPNVHGVLSNVRKNLEMHLDQVSIFCAKRTIV